MIDKTNSLASFEVPARVPDTSNGPVCIVFIASVAKTICSIHQAKRVPFSNGKCCNEDLK